jgi:hypothetical protein
MRQPYDENGNPVATVRLGTCEEIDGSGGSAQNSTAIASRVIRIYAVSGTVRFKIAENPTATATSIPITEGSEMYQPVPQGHKIAIYGGVANVAQVE